MNDPVAETESVSFRRYAFRSELHGHHSTYYHNHQFFLDDLHPAIQQSIAVRSANTFLTGQVVTTRLAALTPYTVEELAGELGGGLPVDPSDPRKDLLVRTTAALVNAVWMEMPAWATGLAAQLDDDLVQALDEPESLFPEIDRQIEGHSFRGVRMLYRPRGGMFTLLAGIVLDYGPDQEWTFLLSDLEGHPLAEQATGFLRRLLAWRNTQTDRHAEAALEEIMLTVIAEIGADILAKKAPAVLAPEMTPIPYLERVAMLGVKWDCGHEELRHRLCAEMMAADPAKAAEDFTDVDYTATILNVLTKEGIPEERETVHGFSPDFLDAARAATSEEGSKAHVNVEYGQDAHDACVGVLTPEEQEAGYRAMEAEAQQRTAHQMPEGGLLRTAE